MNLELFLYTIREYKRFATQLPINIGASLEKIYDEREYVAIQIRLMLLRKYTSRGKKNNVYLENLIEEAEEKYPNANVELEQIRQKYLDIEKQKIVQILSDGTKLDLYKTIEDTMYGVYLHADADKIIRLLKTSEALRFSCIRKYVIEVEKIVLELGDLFEKYGVNSVSKQIFQRAPVIYMGDSNTEKQQISSSPYWSNLYGHDARDEEINQLLEDMSIEEKTILILAMVFLKLLSQKPIPVSKLQKCVFPSTYSAWGDFSEAQKFYESIPNPGLSHKVRYNNEHTIAYVRIFSNVVGEFMINTPHLLDDLHEIALVKCQSEGWCVYSMGAHIDSIQ